jgi:high-affinity Fe2+/Pb2+ permease
MTIDRVDRREAWLRAYRWVCLAGAVIGAAAAAYFYVDGDAVLGSFFVVLTALLVPAYAGFAWAMRRRRS